MKRELALAACWVVAGVSGFSATALAADAPKTIIPVFRVEFEPEDKFRSLIFTDYFPNAGAEVLGLTNSCTRSAPDGNGMVTTTVRTRVTLRSATGGPNLFSVVPAITSLPYPDPANANNQCGGSNQTEFDEGDYPNTQQLGCARDPGDPPYQGQSFDPNGDSACEQPVVGGHFGMGRATGSGDVNYIVFSDAITGTYRNAATGFNDVDAGNFAITVYNMSGVRAWTKSFGAFTSVGRLEPVLAGVGDFLNDDGEDELRVAYIEEGGGVTNFRYFYYDIDTGVKIGATVTVGVAAP